MDVTLYDELLDVLSEKEAEVIKTLLSLGKGRGKIRITNIPNTYRVIEVQLSININEYSKVRKLLGKYLYRVPPANGKEEFVYHSPRLAIYAVLLGYNLFIVIITNDIRE